MLVFRQTDRQKMVFGRHFAEQPFRVKKHDISLAWSKFCEIIITKPYFLPNNVYYLNKHRNALKFMYKAINTFFVHKTNNFLNFKFCFSVYSKWKLTGRRQSSQLISKNYSKLTSCTSTPDGI